jgi:hypothetical protein
MRYRNSITSVPGFWELVLGLGILLISTIYVGFETGGIIGGISSGLHAIYNIFYGSFTVAYLWMIVAWTFFKWDILMGIGIPIVLWISSFIYYKRG